jgi:hypothetical protein
MAHALLWACLDPIAKNNVPEALQKRVEDAWKEKFLESDDGEDAPIAEGVPNPIVKVPLHVWSTDNGDLRIDEVNVVQPSVPAPPQGNVAADDAAPGAPHANAPAQVANQVGVGAMPNGVTQEQYIQLLNQIHQLRTSMTTMHQQMDSHFSSIRQHLDTQHSRLNQNIRLFGGNIQGAFVRGANAHAAQQQANQAHAEANPNAVIDEPPGRATLKDRPRTLYKLWVEYTQGHDGAKPAREFTMRECNNRRNGIKQKYYQWKIVWDMIAQLVCEGMTAHGACHRIRQCYGFNYSVTQIINKLQYDKTHQPGGRHPNLR